MVNFTEKIKGNTFSAKYLEAWFVLTRDDILHGLLNEYVIINGDMYAVPEHHFLELLANKEFGKIKLKLRHVG